MAIKILITDDDGLIRRELRRFLSSEHDFEVIGEAQDGQEAIDVAKRFRPDVIVMDVSMPVLNGIEATRRISAEIPTVKIVGISVYGNQKQIRDMLAAGAAGYILKESLIEEIIPTIRGLAKGEHYFGPDVIDVT